MPGAAAADDKGASRLMKATWIRLLKRAKGGRLKNSDICVSERAFCSGETLFSLLFCCCSKCLRRGWFDLVKTLMIAGEGAREIPVIFLSSLSCVVIYYQRKSLKQVFSLANSH